MRKGLKTSSDQVLEAGIYACINQNLSQRHFSVRDELLHHQLEVNTPSLALQTHSLRGVGGKIVGLQPLFHVPAASANQVLANRCSTDGAIHAALTGIEQAQVCQYLCLGAHH